MQKATLDAEMSFVRVALLKDDIKFGEEAVRRRLRKNDQEEEKFLDTQQIKNAKRETKLLMRGRN